MRYCHRVPKGQGRGMIRRSVVLAREVGDLADCKVVQIDSDQPKLPERVGVNPLNPARSLRWQEQSQEKSRNDQIHHPGRHVFEDAPIPGAC